MKHILPFTIVSLLIILLFSGGIYFYSISSHTSNLTNSTFPPIHHVFIIVEENHDWSTIYQNPDAPFINKLILQQAAYASNYHNSPAFQPALHPSEPNYLVLEAGTTSFTDHTFTTDKDPTEDNSTSSHLHLSYLFDKNGLTWRSYQEGMSIDTCPITSNGNYAAKHNPFLFFTDVSGNPPLTSNRYCRQHIQPLPQLLADLNHNTVANYSFITPNILHDMHSGSIKNADDWLSTIVPHITNSTAFKKDGVLFITWDEGSEDSTANASIGMIMLSPFIKRAYTNSLPYSHLSYVKTIEEIYHFSPLIGNTSNKNVFDLSNFFHTK